MSNYKKGDTFDEMLFEKILNGGSIRYEVNRLRHMARQCIDRAKIATESKLVVHLDKAVESAGTDKDKREMRHVFMEEILKKYDMLHDDLFIVSAFENYAKAVLLSKRYMIHKLTKPSVLSKKQYNSPVHISTIRSKKYREEIFIDHYTIGINQLLKPNYLDKLNLSCSELEAIRHCRYVRNGIHSGGVRVVGFGAELYKGLSELYERIKN